MLQLASMEATKKWYQKPLTIIASLVFFFPAGLFLMWKYAGWNKKIKWGITGLIAFLFIVGANADSQNSTQVASTNQQSQAISTQPSITPTQSPITSINEEAIEKTYLVTKVIDGDTIEVEGGQRVRYIGIDTPETVDPNRPVQCFGQEASDQNKALVLNKQVRLEKDISETDKYGRLLRYVWVENTFVNDRMVRQGYANASTYPPDVKYQQQFTQAQQEAITNLRGLWSSCQANTQSTKPTATIAPTQNNTTGGQTQQTGSCNIKGNISASGEKIYHLPGCQSYNKTKIDTGAGERMFCSEQEAVQAGWRKAGNCP